MAAAPAAAALPLSELRDLLDVPAIAARFGVPPILPRLAQWMAAPASAGA
jgi:hypothetical protein